MAEHRVPMLSPRCAGTRIPRHSRRSADPSRSSPQLRTLELAPAPRAHFRAELRAQLVAVAPRMVAEGAADRAPRATGRPAHAGARRAAADARPRGARSPARPDSRSAGRSAIAHRGRRGLRRAARRRGVDQQEALPGDALYSLKRASENVQLSLADGATAKSKAYLDFADSAPTRSRRCSSARRRRPSAPGRARGRRSARTPRASSRSTLDSADRDVARHAAARRQAVRSSPAHPLGARDRVGAGPADPGCRHIADRLPAGRCTTRGASRRARRAAR